MRIIIRATVREWLIACHLNHATERVYLPPPDYGEGRWEWVSTFLMPIPSVCARLPPPPE